MAGLRRDVRRSALFVLGLVMTAPAASAARAQQTGEGVPSVARSGVASKVDEFGRVGGCDHSARLDHFAILLMNEPDVTGYVVVYGPGGEAGGSGPSRLRVTENYLVNERGIDASRLKTVYGGPYKELRESATELWLVPPGADAPEPSRYQNDADTFTGKLDEGGAWDSLDYGESLGPPIGDVSGAALADMLKSRPDTRAYVVVYHGEDSTLGMWRRVGTREAETLRRGAGVKADRVEVIFGGYREEAAVERWLLPADAPPPVLMAEETRRPEESVHLGTFHDYTLSYEDDARWVFKGFADVLREDEHMRAFVIVRPEFGATAQGSGDAPASPDELPEVDLVRLAEKWKKDLVEEYGLGAERLVVIVAPARDESEAGELETWLVPPGAAPPDPYAEEEVEETEEDDGGAAGVEDEPAAEDPAH